MYIACQNRDGDLDNFFAHENQSWPPALAENNEMRLGSKADLLEPLEKLCCKPHVHPDVDCIIIDGAVAVQSLDAHRSNAIMKTFADYAEKIFLPHISKQLKFVSRLDIVWDIYG